MSDVPITTRVVTPLGELHFQEYWILHRGAPAVLDIRRSSIALPVATEEVLTAIRESDAVIIGPSNPVTSILPILECSGVRERLRERRVLAVSPFIGRQPVSGPAGALMEAWGLEPSSRGVFGLYRDLLTYFVQDVRDEVEVPGAHRLDTLMTGPERSRDLAGEILGILDV